MFSLLRFLLVISWIVLLLQGCTTPPVSVEGNGARAEWLKENWVPKTEEALKRFDALTLSTTGKSVSRKTEVRLALSADLAKDASARNPQAVVVRMDRGSYAQQYKQAVIQPLHTAALQWQHDISSGHEERVPTWLREGIAYETAYLVLDGIKTPALTSVDCRDDNEGAVRKKKDIPSASALLSGEASAPSAAGFAEMSAVFVDLLRVRKGENFQAAWLQYFRAAGMPGFAHDTAFNAAFGLSPTDFESLAKTRVEQLRTVRNEHAAPLLATLTPFLDANTPAPPLPTSGLREAYAKYLKGDSPKAFAFSRQGYWSADYDSTFSIERAMRLCGVGAPLGCKLYAVDDKVIAPTNNAHSVDVVMFGSSTDWAKTVEQRWLPVVKTSARHFNAALQEKLGVSLVDSARIYVVSSREDYGRVLNTEIRQVLTAAERTAAASDGFSNGRGQMVTSVFADVHDDFRWQLATTTTLHELVHELQGQLTAGNEGFAPQRWMTEGSADQIAYLIAKDMPLEPTAKYEVNNWQERCIDWYKLGGARTTRPEDVLDVNFEQWLTLAKSEKSPYGMSGLMVMHMESLLGKKYYPALVRYWKLAAQKGQTEEDAFSTSFGMSREQFLGSLKTWLATLAAPA
jgi:hypothetical protein